MFASLGIDLATSILLCLALLLALSFEFVNGFHDTANAVATVIYTNSLKPTHAVVWSGLWNLIGGAHLLRRSRIRHRRIAAGRTRHQRRLGCGRCNGVL